MNEVIKTYLSGIGRKGGKMSRRSWTAEQKEKMITKLIETLRKKKMGKSDV